MKQQEDTSHAILQLTRFKIKHLLHLVETTDMRRPEEYEYGSNKVFKMRHGLHDVKQICQDTGTPPHECAEGSRALLAENRDLVLPITH